MKRSFEKINFNQFCKDIKNDKILYDNYNLPNRKTINSAGYDFEIIEQFTIKPKEIKKIPTGIKAKMAENEVLMLFIRSSIGFKYNIRLTNQTGIIDSDYYNNTNNEGHIWLSIQNEGDKEMIFNKGESIVQGMFTNFLTVAEDNFKTVRKGGIGSTNEEGK